jgi:hypothetical protein
VTGNLAGRNGEAGIVISGAVEDATLTGNRVRHNHGLGIDAGPGVSDGGRNIGRANGAAAQCAGVLCRP